VPLDLNETDPEKNPLLLPHVIDAPLTEKGVQQCLERRAMASKFNVELIIVSPLVRALQTAQITFGDHLPPNVDRRSNNNNNNNAVKWLAHEGCREELGLLLCNQRRPLSETKAEFPHVDFSHHSTLILKSIALISCRPTMAVDDAAARAPVGQSVRRDNNNNNI